MGKMVRKALIPVAGKGTRLMPVTSVVPKCMFPLVNSKDEIRPVMHIICEQAISAGVESIGIVVSPWQTEMVRQYFVAARECGFAKLPAHIEYITQESPRGFGDAVLQGLDFIGEEPFMVLLGDHICLADEDKPSCVLQVVTAHNTLDAVAMIGMRLVTAGELSKVGVASGVEIEQRVYRCTRFMEKPDLATARQKLVTKGLGEDEFLAHSGIYVFLPDIFDCLLQVSKTVGRKGGEVELADAQSLLLEKHP
ncbi:MAG: sugar phosphate nucleotidyltransferase, partial [Planctomycetota bacterium]